MNTLRLSGRALGLCAAAMLLAACGGSQQAPISAMPLTVPLHRHSMTFNYTGAQQNFIVPNNVTQVTVLASGAAGSSTDVPGGWGGSVRATIPVTPGESLAIFVGGSPFNGGGASDDDGGGAVGGGASDVRRGGTDLSHRVVIAGGGGGAGGKYNCIPAGAGGPGGALVGGNGGEGNKYCPVPGQGGSGGTQQAGGAGGSYGGGVGRLGAGGSGGSEQDWPCRDCTSGGGGGGGY